MSAQDDDAKRRAAVAALELVHDGMLVGLGTGSTARHFVEGLGRLAADGLRVTCVASSTRTEWQAIRAGLAPVALDAVPHLDLTVDGADAFDERLASVKGAGGALLRERLLLTLSRQRVLVVDASKFRRRAPAVALPVEVARWGVQHVVERIRRAGHEASIRMADGVPSTTDGGNCLLDVATGSWDALPELAGRLRAIDGVLDTGWFGGVFDRAYVADADGVRTLDVKRTT